MLEVEFNEQLYAERKGITVSETPENLANEFEQMSDALSWSVVSSEVFGPKGEDSTDVVQTILARPRTGPGGGIPLTRGEVAMLFLDGHAGDGPGLLDIRSQGYGEDSSPPARGGVADVSGERTSDGVERDWDGLTHEDIFSTDEGPDAAFVRSKWEPLELWLNHS